MAEHVRSGSLPEVPWVMGDPHASYEWQVSVAQKEKKKGRRLKPAKLENIVVQVRLNVKKRKVRGSFISKLVGGAIEEDFNPITVAEKLLRALHFAKFKKILKISLDREVLYEAGDEAFKAIIQLLKDSEFAGILNKQVKISFEHRAHWTATIDIRRVHLRKKPPITISLNGRIDHKDLDRLLGYIKKHLPIEDIRY